MVTVSIEGLGALTNPIVEGPPPVAEAFGAQPTSSEAVLGGGAGQRPSGRARAVSGGPARVAEIRAYDASPQDGAGDRLELERFDHAGRGCPPEPRVGR